MSLPPFPSRKRRAFTASFKAQVVLSLLTGTKTQAELCREHELSPNLLAQWKDAFLANAAAAFQSRERTVPRRPASPNSNAPWAAPHWRTKS
jgi:transposase